MSNINKVPNEMQLLVAPVSASIGMLIWWAEEDGMLPQMNRSGPWSTAAGTGRESLTCWVVTLAFIFEK